MVVGDAEQAVLAPAIRPRTSMVVREGVPGTAVGGVVLAHRAPLSLRKVRSPAPPWLSVFALIDQSLAFGRRRAASAGDWLAQQFPRRAVRIRSAHAWTVPS